MPHVDVGDTRLWIEERGDGFPLLVLHGGPGLDHHEFAGYLDPLGDSYRLILTDLRSQGLSDPAPEETWTLPRMAADVAALAASLNLERWAVLGHSYGAFVALQHAVDYPAGPAATIVSSGVPAMRFLSSFVADNLAAFMPETLREQVARSWEAEKSARTQDDCRRLLEDQMPFHFKDPADPRIEEYLANTAGTVYSPDVLRWAATSDTAGIEVEARLGAVRHPMLVLAGRHDRACSVEAAEAIAAGVGDATVVVLERSGHMTFVEENDAYLGAVRSFLDPLRRGSRESALPTSSS